MRIDWICDAGHKWRTPPSSWQHQNRPAQRFVRDDSFPGASVDASAGTHVLNHKAAIPGMHTQPVRLNRPPERRTCHCNSMIWHCLAGHLEGLTLAMGPGFGQPPFSGLSPHQQVISTLTVLVTSLCACLVDMPVTVTMEWFPMHGSVEYTIILRLRKAVSAFAVCSEAITDLLSHATRALQ